MRDCVFLEKALKNKDKPRKDSNDEFETLKGKTTGVRKDKLLSASLF